MRTSISKKLLAGALSVMMVVSLFAGIPANNAQAASKKVQLSATKATLAAGKSKTITIKNVKSSNVKKLTLTTSKKTVATVKKVSNVKFKVTGSKKLTAKKTATITAKIALKKAVNGKKSYTLKFKATVKAKAATKVALTGVSLSNSAPKVGDTITATVEPADATNVTYQWFSGASADAVTTAIEGATSASYTVKDTDLGRYLSVTVTGENNSVFTATTTAAVAPAAATDLAITAEQTGATTIKVTANNAVATTDSVVVTRGTSTVSSTFTVDATGTIITITTGTKLADAEYTVTVTPKDTTKKSASTKFTAKVATLEKIDFVGENLILADSTYKQASVKIFGYNSFNEEVALSTLTPYTSKGDVEYKAADNEIIVKATGAALFQTGEQITVTAVYQDGTTVKQVSKALTVSAAATLAEIKLGELKSSNAALKDKRVDLTNMSSGTYYKEVEAKDQYGNTLSAAKLNSMLYSSTNNTGTLFATPSQADGAYVYLTGFDTTSDKKVIAKYNLGSLAMPGTQTFTFTAVGGYTATDSIEVVDNSYIATLNVEVPELYGGKEAEIVVTAVDQYGDAVNLYDVTDAKTVDQTAAVVSADYTFKGQNSTTKTQAKLTVPAGMKLKVTKNTSKKTVKFTLTPKANTTTSNVQYVLLAQSATPTINNIQCVVQPNAAVYGIATALYHGGTSVTVKNGDTANLTKEVVILDQYGAVISTLASLNALAATDPKYVAIDSTKKVEASTQNGGGHNDGDFVVNITDKNGALDAGTTCGAGTYTVTLWKIGSKADSAANTGDANSKLAERTFTVIVGDATYEKYEAVVSAGDELLYVGSEDDSAFIEVYGTDKKGNEVELEYGTDFDLTVDNADMLTLGTYAANLGVNIAYGYVKVDTGKAKTLAADGKVEGTATVTVWDKKGNEVATTTVKYSNEAPKATSVYAVKGTSAFAKTEIELQTGCATTAVNNTPDSLADMTLTDGTTVYTLGIHDQYGVPFIGQQATIGATPVGNGNVSFGKDASKTLKITGGSLSQTWTLVNSTGSGLNLANVLTAGAPSVTIAAEESTLEPTLAHDVSITVSAVQEAGTAELQVADSLNGTYTKVNGVTWTIDGSGTAAGAFTTATNNVSANANLTRGKFYRIVLHATDADRYSDVTVGGAVFAYATTNPTIAVTAMTNGAKYEATVSRTATKDIDGNVKIYKTDATTGTPTGLTGATQVGGTCTVDNTNSSAAHVYTSADNCVTADANVFAVLTVEAGVFSADSLTVYSPIVTVS